MYTARYENAPPLAGVVNVDDVAIPLAFNGSVSGPNTIVPVQLLEANNVNVTVPVGAGTEAGVPDVFDTVAWSCTTVPAVIVVFVTSLFDASNTFVEIAASENVFTASPEFGAFPSVATTTAVVVPRSDNEAVACPVTVPAEFDVNVIVH